MDSKAKLTLGIMDCTGDAGSKLLGPNGRPMRSAYVFKIKISSILRPEAARSIALRQDAAGSPE